MRALVYDRTAPRLGRVWTAGSWLFRGATCGVDDWDSALRWVAALPEPIDELQYWGHGKWGCALVDNDVLDASSLASRRPLLEAVRERLAPGALVWLRTCETFGARRGIDFAERLADFLGARVAGHTYVIDFHQSGLYGLEPGMRAHWSLEDGLLEGTADAPVRAKRSVPWAPHTITMFGRRVPERWFR